MSASLKMLITSLEEGPEQTAVHFHANYADDRNKEWAYYTPAASIVVNVRNEIVESQGWKLGMPVHVTIETESEG